MHAPAGELAGIAAALCWAAGSLIFERITRGSPATAAATNAAKSTVGFGVLFAASLATQGLPGAGVDAGDLALLAMSAVIGISIGDTAFFGALRSLGASRAVLLLSTAPVFAVLIEAAIARALPPGRELFGIALTLAGLALVLGRSGAGPSATKSPALGVAMGALSGLSQAAGSLLSRAATRGSIDPLRASWFRLAVAAVVLIGVGTVTGQARPWARQLRTPGLFARIAGASLIGTVLGLFLAQVALARSRSGGVASTLLATSPIFALPLSHLWGSERATVRSMAGVGLAFAGIAVLLS